MRFLVSKKRYGFLKSPKGLTLAECLVSILLLAITLVAGMAFYFNSGAIMGQAMHKKMAMEMANQAMEKYKQAGYAALPAVTANFVNDAVVTFGDFSVQPSHRVTVVQGFKQVEIEVRWTESGKPAANVIALSTYMAP